MLVENTLFRTTFGFFCLSCVQIFSTDCGIGQHSRCARLNLNNTT
ncbi:Uncharacterised protein [Vibrio cholerae]|nr:Uncharacterised protein [Vibrio cholerae]